VIPSLTGLALSLLSNGAIEACHRGVEASPYLAGALPRQLAEALECIAQIAYPSSCRQHLGAGALGQLLELLTHGERLAVVVFQLRAHFGAFGAMPLEYRIAMPLELFP